MCNSSWRTALARKHKEPIGKGEGRDFHLFKAPRQTQQSLRL